MSGGGRFLLSRTSDALSGASINFLSNGEILVANTANLVNSTVMEAVLETGSHLKVGAGLLLPIHDISGTTTLFTPFTSGSSTRVFR